MQKLLVNLTLVFFVSSSACFAALLPDPENVRVSGSTLEWDAVDNATGYNIYLDYSYLDTVKGALSYELSEPGSYWVAAFDGNGNFGSQYGRDDDFNDLQPQFDPQVTDNTSITVNSFSTVVQKTCTDVGPGESCVAFCPESVPFFGGDAFTKYMSGGACSTSDIVEADAFVSNRSYKCTVPTFSGEVIAQAICVHF